LLLGAGREAVVAFGDAEQQAALFVVRHSLRDRARFCGALANGEVSDSHRRQSIQWPRTPLHYSRRTRHFVYLIGHGRESVGAWIIGELKPPAPIAPSEMKFDERAAMVVRAEVD
jgi:hypothetical protein